MATLTQTYTYLRSSTLRESAAGRTLALETSGGATPAGAAANPRFFSGFLTAPVPSAVALLAVADVAATRYHLPRATSSLDPVVTANGDRLRFESFSGCCGVYARLDVLAPGLHGDEVGHGTTNVDVGLPLRRALARLGGVDPLHLAVGPEALEVKTFDGRFVEKKVPLPERWIRGFAEAQGAPDPARSRRTPGHCGRCCCAPVTRPVARPESHPAVSRVFSAVESVSRRSRAHP